MSHPLEDAAQSKKAEDDLKGKERESTPPTPPLSPTSIKREKSSDSSDSSDLEESGSPTLPNLMSGGKRGGLKRLMMVFPSEWLFSN